MILNDNNSDVNEHFTSYIYINKDSLSSDLCDIIIKKYDESKNKYKGVTGSGVHIDIKDTVDLVTTDSEWIEMNDTLSAELRQNLKEYMVRFECEDYKASNNFSTAHDHKIINDPVKISQFMVQKYDKNKGRYIYHNDFDMDSDGSYRVLTYLWYLNDVTEGGETVFSGVYKIKPKRGTLVIFPASWTFPHCGKMPVSDDKYIVTGWIYNKIVKK